MMIITRLHWYFLCRHPLSLKDRNKVGMTNRRSPRLQKLSHEPEREAGEDCFICLLPVTPRSESVLFLACCRHMVHGHCQVQWEQYNPVRCGHCQQKVVRRLSSRDVVIPFSLEDVAIPPLLEQSLDSILAIMQFFVALALYKWGESDRKYLLDMSNGIIYLFLFLPVMKVIYSAFDSRGRLLMQLARVEHLRRTYAR